ncbi:MAG: protease modulator HflK [Phycisphaerales bacterium]|nr:MAG: protease modulator HflK [Phycisphaerales bacterium]
MTGSCHCHPPKTPGPDEVPLDAASQSLADALRASFRILKAIMFLLVIVFLCSGIGIVDNSEEAVVLQFGKLKLKDGRPYPPGILWALPYPVDEPLKVPTKQRNKLRIMSHWFHIREADEAKPLRELSVLYRGKLDPAKDGALLTADEGLVHVKWTLFYRIHDLEQFVCNVADTVGDDVDTLVTSLLESAAIRVVAGYSAAEVDRTKTADMAARVRSEVNAALDRLGAGIRVESLEPETTVPMDTIDAFAEVTRKENEKATRIQEARKQANEILTSTAGDAHEYLTETIEALKQARAEGDASQVAALQAEVDEALEVRASGQAGSMISQAKAYYTKAVQKIEGDVEGYRAVLDEYSRSPKLLINRLWQEARTRLLAAEGVTKIGIPLGVKEIRVQLGPDPQQRELDEIERLKKEKDARSGPGSPGATGRK